MTQQYLVDQNFKKVKIKMSTGEIVEIAPGEKTADLPRTAVPKYGFVHLMRQPDGSYTPVLQSWGEMIRMTSDLPHRIGLNTDYSTLRRLLIAGFIKYRHFSPGTILIDLQSLYEHMDACKDPEFWTPERIKRYRQAL